MRPSKAQNRGRDIFIYKPMFRDRNHNNLVSSANEASLKLCHPSNTTTTVSSVRDQ